MKQHCGRAGKGLGQGPVCEKEEDAVRRKALRLLEVRARSRQELRERLAAAGFSTAAVTGVLERLGECGLLDDRRFAQERARALAERGYGPRRIAFELGRCGIEGSLIEEALAQAYGEEGRQGRLQRLLRRRFGEVDLAAADVKVKSRAQRFLLSRGFEQEEIMELLR